MNVTAPGLLRLQRPEGAITYSVQGEGPLVVLVPGMGDLRDSHRELVGPLVDAGYRVAVTDVRGHGDADLAFRTYGDTATAGDLLALIDELGGPALIAGNSFAGSAAVVAAGLRPDAVAGLVLLDPFLRGGSAGAVAATRLLFRVLFARPWGAATWAWYYRTALSRGRRAPWLAEHAAALRASMRSPGRLAALRSLVLQLDHREVEPYLDAVRAKALVVVGALDPDYRDPAAELAWMGDRLHAETLLVEEAAHYPHAQRPDVVVPAVLAFAGGLRVRDGWARA